MVHGLNIASFATEEEAENTEILGLLAAIADVIPEILELIFKTQTEGGEPADPIEFLIILGATLGSATVADMLEMLAVNEKA